MGSFWGPHCRGVGKIRQSTRVAPLAIRTCIPQEGFASSCNNRSASLHNLARARRNANWKGQVQHAHTHTLLPSLLHTHTQTPSPLISPAVLRRGLPDPLQSVCMRVCLCACVCNVYVRHRLGQSSRQSSGTGESVTVAAAALH